MIDKPSKPGAPARPVPTAREQRLKAALKANIQRRKAQARERGAEARGNDNDNET